MSSEVNQKITSLKTSIDTFVREHKKDTHSDSPTKEDTRSQWVVDFSMKIRKLFIGCDITSSYEIC